MDTSVYVKERIQNMFRYCFLFLIISVSGFGFSGCAKMLNHHFADTLLPMEGELCVSGPANPVTIRRDDMGIPFINAQTMDDLVFSAGYVNAADRLNQMTALKLISQGRLAEMAGTTAIDIDTYMRTLNLVKAARILHEEIPDELGNLLQQYCNGINAYIDQHKDVLSPELQFSAYTPQKWEPIDSLTIFAFVNLALSFNLHEEINTLNIAQAVGPEKAAWLVPIYPDEAIPLEEAKKLMGINLRNTTPCLESTLQAQRALQDIGFISVAASNNWVISKDRTQGKASIFANDTHLMLSMPSLWNMMHLRCKDYDVAGIGIAGVPSIVAGYNGHIAWGMTMVLADNQDVFLEQLKKINGELHYLYQGKWIPTTKRKETIHIRGKDPLSITVHETIHGPLLNDALKKTPKSPLQPHSTILPLGIALSWAAFESGDKTIEAFFGISRSRSVREAMEHAKQIRAIALNVVIADHDNIAWQVTGRYPIRKKGRGLMPSPGWDGEYDWEGFLDVDKHPFAVNPPQGFIGTANHRSVPADFPYILSSSWYWPERSERIAEMITSTEKHSLKTSMDMQHDIYSRYTSKLQETLLQGDLYRSIEEEINSWENNDRQKKATEAISMLGRFDRTMSLVSKDAAIIGALLYTVTHTAFFDELGPSDSPAWRSLVSNLSHGYCAASDHLAVRGDESPFWDNAATPEKETKAQILARSFADSIDLLEKHLGKDRSEWSWGKMHTYYFETEASKMAGHMGFIQRVGMKFLSPFFNRGPFPAPGDHTTLNVSAYTMGRDFDTWLIPAVRMIVDFSLEEPFVAMNSSGQSDNPVSPHYDDGIYKWLDNNYQSFPFKQKNIEQQYNRVLVLKPSE